MSNPRLQVDIGANTKELDSAIKSIDAKMKQLGQSLMTAGAAFTKAFTAPIVGGAGLAVKAYDTQIKAEARLRTALEANGRQVNALFKDYKDFASGLQQITTVGDETTLEMLQVAEAMGLTGESAKRAVQNAIAMGKAFGVNEKSAIRYTASLEQGDATMLTRYIPALRSVTDEAEKTALAHDILRKAFGAATAEAQVGLGPITQLKNNFGDLMEQIGELVSNAIVPFVERLNNMVLRLQALDKPTKALYTGIALVTAAIGPALLALGALTSLFTFARLKFLAITAAIGVIVAGLVYVAKNFDWFRNEFIRTWNQIVNISVSAVSNVLDALSMLAQGLNIFGAAGFALQGAFTQLKNSLSGFTKEVEDNTLSLMTFDEFVESLKQTFVALFGGIEAISEDALPGLKDEINETINNIDSASVLADQFTSNFAEGLSRVITEGAKLKDVLRDIGMQLLKTGLTKLLEAALFGGTALGTSKGILGSVFPGLISGASPVSASAMVPTMTGANVTVGGQFILRGPDLIATINKTSNTTLR